MAVRKPPRKPSLAKPGRPTLLMVGSDPMGAAIRAAATRYRLQVETSGLAEVSTSVLAAAPDLVLLIGDAAASGGQDVLRLLGLNPATNVVPIAILTDDASLDDKLKAFRYGAVAVVQRSASADEIGKRVAELVKELPNRLGEATGEIGEATLDEFVDLLKRELRSGIVSVGKEGEEDAIRLVLGAGRPVADALADFVKKLKPLIAEAEPLKYELLEESGGRLQLLEPSGLLQLPTEDPSLLAGVRILIMDSDPGRADALAQELREHAAKVAVTEVSLRGLEKAQVLEPEVLIIDGADIEGPAFQLVRSLRKDVRLRWSSMLIVSWDELWPHVDGGPDLPLLTAKIAPLISQDHELSSRAAIEEVFDTRLETTGPSRLVRALSKAKRTLHVTVVSNKASIEVDLSQGLLVGAVGTLTEGGEVAGAAAVASLLSMSSGRVRVEHRMNPSVANIMTPVDQALAAAWAEGSPLVASIPPSHPPTAPPPPPPKEFEDLPVLESAPPLPTLGGPTPPRGTSRAAARTMMGIGSMPKGSPPAPRIAVRNEMLDRLTPKMPPIPPVLGDHDAEVPRVTVRKPEEGTTDVLTSSGAAGVIVEDLDLFAGDLETVRPPPSLVPEELGDSSLGSSESSGRAERGDPTLSDPLAPRTTAASKPPEFSKSSSKSASNRNIPTERPAAAKPKSTNTAALGLLLVALLAGGSVAAWILVPELRQALGYPDTVATTGDPAAVIANDAGVQDAQGAQDAQDVQNTPGTPDAAVLAAVDDVSLDGALAVASPVDAGANDAGTPDTQDTQDSPDAAALAAADVDAGAAVESTEGGDTEAPGAEAVDRGRSARSLVADGERLIRRGETEAAGPLLERAYELDPHDNHVLAGLARVYIARGDGPRAVEMAEAACRKRARRASYRMLLGQANEMAGNLDAARAAYRRVLAQESGHPGAQRRLEALSE